MIIKKDNIPFLEGYFISKNGRDMISLAILLKNLGIELNIILLNKGTSLFKDAGRYIIYIG